MNAGRANGRLLFRTTFSVVFGQSAKNSRSTRKLLAEKNFYGPVALAAAAGAVAVSWRCLEKKSFDWSFSLVTRVRAADETDAAGGGQRYKLKTRELRFLNFASYEFNGNVYMSPRDFLDSLTEQQPRSRLRRHLLTEEQVTAILNNTPAFRKSSTHFFRALDENGIITYTEYLFLLSVLTKPQSGFRIAFNLFDLDGNERVDKNEFLVIRELMNLMRSDGKLPYFGVNDIASTIEHGTSLEQLLSKRRTKAAKNSEEKGSEGGESGGNPLPMSQDTTLLRHLFGRKGDAALNFKDFLRFSDNLQDEILEIEFNEFSRGRPTIKETDFARLLLRYTVVHMEDYNEYIKRIEERIPQQKGVTFQQFRAFCRFLNSLDDFAVAIKLYTFAGHPVSEEEFGRAVKVSTGEPLDPQVIRTVFSIFDVNNDGRLSYSEFAAVMKDRIHRGFRSHLIKQSGSWWNNYKSCVREQMKTY